MHYTNDRNEHDRDARTSNENPKTVSRISYCVMHTSIPIFASITTACTTVVQRQ